MELSAFIQSGLGIDVVVLRLVLAALLGGVIGFDRERQDRPAGLRTHMLVSLAAATFAIITLEIMARADGNSNTDPIRIVEAVTAGVAFLAAGTIIQSRGRVHGLTTGASLWLAGAIGTAVGIGVYPVAVLAVVLGLILLTLIHMLEKRFVPEAPDRRGVEDGGGD